MPSSTGLYAIQTPRHLAEGPNRWMRCWTSWLSSLCQSFLFPFRTKSTSTTYKAGQTPSTFSWEDAATFGTDSRSVMRSILRRWQVNLWSEKLAMALRAWCTCLSDTRIKVRNTWSARRGRADTFVDFVLSCTASTRRNLVTLWLLSWMFDWSSKRSYTSGCTQTWLAIHASRPVEEFVCVAIL